MLVQEIGREALLKGDSIEAVQEMVVGAQVHFQLLVGSCLFPLLRRP